MKKLISAIITLVLVLTLCTCTAESIFDQLPETHQETTHLTAPSYGGMANVSPDSIEKSVDGGNIVTYLGVEASGYNSFGSYLGQLGFSVTSKEEREGKVAYAVTNGTVSFSMIYDPEACKMQLIYPKGTDYEESLYPGYIRINANEEFTVPGIGRITFRDMVLEGSAKYANYFSDPQTSGGTATLVRTWIPFHIFNISNRELVFINHYDNTILKATLVYSNEDGEYSYQALYYGSYDSVQQLIAFDPHGGNTYLDNMPLPSLTEKELAVGFDLPESLMKSRNGTIAIKLDFFDGQKYVLVVRENGVNLSIASPQGD